MFFYFRRAQRDSARKTSKFGLDEPWHRINMLKLLSVQAVPKVIVI
jgi:hypothetical protein